MSVKWIEWNEAGGRPSGSRHVNEAAARRAIELATPLVEAGRRDRALVGSGFLHVVIMDPALPPGLATFDEAILHEHSFGDRRHWDADYAAFARAKAQLSWRWERDSFRLQHDSPHLLSGGDPKLWGSVWLDGIVVGVSGAFPSYDEVYAGTIAFFLRALARNAHALEDDRPALGEHRPGPAPIRIQG